MIKTSPVNIHSEVADSGVAAGARGIPKSRNRKGSRLCHWMD
jgi:hypothetical protein